MANTHAEIRGVAGAAKRITKSYETSGANAIVAVTTPVTGSRPRRLVAVYVKYSTSVTKNVTVSIDAAHGSGYDALLTTIALTAVASGAYMPDTDIWIFPLDAFVVSAEAGGGGVTCGLTVVTEEGD